MIKSCEDIKTLDEFHKLGDYRLRTIDIGLLETANMLSWNRGCLISPDLFDMLVDERRIWK